MTMTCIRPMYAGEHNREVLRANDLVRCMCGSATCRDADLNRRRVIRRGREGSSDRVIIIAERDGVYASFRVLGVRMRVAFGKRYRWCFHIGGASS